MDPMGKALFPGYGWHCWGEKYEKWEKMMSFGVIGSHRTSGEGGKILVAYLEDHPRTCTLPETNSSHLKIGLPNRKVVFQPSIFRGYVSFGECKWSTTMVIGGPLSRVVGPLPNGRLVNGGDPNHLLNGMILQAYWAQTSKKNERDNGS